MLTYTCPCPAHVSSMCFHWEQLLCKTFATKTDWTPHCAKHKRGSGIWKSHSLHNNVWPTQSNELWMPHPRERGAPPTRSSSNVDLLVAHSPPPPDVKKLCRNPRDHRKKNKASKAWMDVSARVENTPLIHSRTLESPPFNFQANQGHSRGLSHFKSRLLRWRSKTEWVQNSLLILWKCLCLFSHKMHVSAACSMFREMMCTCKRQNDHQIHFLRRAAVCNYVRQSWSGLRAAHDVSSGE